MATGQPNHDHDQQLHLLLEICEDLFGRTGPAARGEVDALLRARGITGGPGWLIDISASPAYAGEPQPATTSPAPDTTPDTRSARGPNKINI